MREWLRKLTWRLQGRRKERELRDELEFHLSEETDERRDAGLSEVPARTAARKDFGNVSLVAEDTRAVWTWTRLEQLAHDLRAGARILTHSPGLSAAVVLLVALVVGGNTVIYSTVHAILSKPAPGVTVDRLVTLSHQVDGRPAMAGISIPDYDDYAEQLRTIRRLLATNFESFTLSADTGSYAIRGASVTTNYFDTIGVRPIVGRAFTNNDRGGASGLVAVIGYRLWQEHFRGSADVLGRGIELNGHPATIVGVAPEGFRGLFLTETAQVWVPLVAFARATGRKAINDRAERTAMSIGHLAPDASIADARLELAAVAARQAAAYPDTNRNRTVIPVPYSMTAGGDSIVSLRGFQFLAVFSVVTAITLVVVCANVGNLMLARVVARQREIAVRLSLGASRLRVVRLLLAEALVLSALACIAAFLLASWVATTMPAILEIPVLIDTAPDWNVTAYAVLLAGACAVIFSLMPVMRVWRQQLLPSLKPGEHGITSGRSRTSRILAVVQVACCVLLLTMSGLAYRSLSLVAATDLGFASDHLALVRVNTSSVSNPATNLALSAELCERLAHTPGAAGAAYVSSVPPYGSLNVLVRTNAAAPPFSAAVNHVGHGFFALLGIPTISGREFTQDDSTRSAEVAVINQYLADSLWPGQPAIGRTLMLGDNPRPLEVVGVVANAMVTGARTEARPFFAYLTRRHRAPGPAWFYVKFTGAFDEFVPALRASLRDFNSRIPIETIITMDDALGQTTLPSRMITTLLSLFAFGSLIVASVGLYAVLAFSLSRRTREFGVRVALGATAARVVGAVLREGTSLTVAGLVVGFVLSVIVASLARNLLFGITPTDLRTYSGVFALLTTVSLVASYLPARRASRLDPVKALRQE